MTPPPAASGPWRKLLDRGLVIPAHPLALDARRRLDERRQRALSRYYLAAGAGGLAVGVHTTQFAIREPRYGLYRPVLEIAAEEMLRHEERTGATVVRVGGVCGLTEQALREAGLLRELGYHAALVSLGALARATEDELIAHCSRVASAIPVFGFYLQPAVGGRHLPYAFWRRFAEIPEVAAIKIAPFGRYETLDVVRAVVDSGRDDIALYTGNDDSIVVDLLTPFRFQRAGSVMERRLVGGLLGHWAAWTRRAVELLRSCQYAVQSGGEVSPELLRLAVEVTDSNAALFDAAHGFRGCIAGIHEVLRRQGLLEGIWCLDPAETLSPGQLEEIDRVSQAYPYLRDDDFVETYRDAWLSG